MDQNAITSGVAQRYGLSLFELSSEKNVVEHVEKDLADFERLIGESEDLRRLIRSPVFSAEEQLGAMSAIVDKAGLGGSLTGNFLKVVAKNRRLFALEGMIRAYRDMAARARGEVTASVTVAHELNDGQRDKLKSTLAEIAGKDVTLDLTVDPAILGGMVVRLGSRQIDTSLRSKLQSLRINLTRAAS